MRDKWGEWLAERWDRRSLIFLISALVLVWLYFWHLGSSPLSGAEQSARDLALSLHQILHQPLNAPHKLVQFVLGRLSDSNFEVRAASGLFSLLFVYSFYAILRCWFGTFSAWLGALFFGATPLFILAGRSATPSIMYLWPIVLVASYMMMVRSRNRLAWRLALLSLVAALCVYQPGGIIAVLIGGFYVRSSLPGLINKSSRRALGLISLLFIIILLPLIVAVIRQPDLLKSLFLLPQHFPKLSDLVKNFAWAIAAFFWHSRTHNEFQLGRLAILNAAQIILLIFGVYALWIRARPKLYDMLALVLLAALASVLNGSYNLLLLGLPALGLVITAGLRYLHLEWTSVFPRNPLPRGLALGLLVILVGLHIAWGAHYALSAWPHRLPIL